MGGSASTFEVVSFNRSPNKLGIKTGRGTVAMSRTNVEKWLSTGATLVSRKR